MAERMSPSVEEREAAVADQLVRDHSLERETAEAYAVSAVAAWRLFRD